MLSDGVEARSETLAHGALDREERRRQRLVLNGSAKDRLLADGNPLGLGLWNEIERRLMMLSERSGEQN